MQAATTMERPFTSMSALIREHALKGGDRTALIHRCRKISYRELDAMVDQVASTLQRDGVRSGEAVAICAASSVEYAAVFLGALRAGAVVAPLAPSSTAANLAGMVADANAGILFADAVVAAMLEGVAAELGNVRLARLDTQAFVDWLGPAGKPPADVPVTAQQPFNIIYSSGTTGTPKGVVQSHGMRWNHVCRSALTGYGQDSVTLLSTPLYSNTTLVSFIPTLALGGTVILMDKFDVIDYLELAQQYRVTNTMLVPVQYRRLLAHPEFERYDLSSFRTKFCTSAPFSAELKADVLRRWPGGLVELYGMTEGGGTCMLAAHAFPDKLHTVGQPAPGSDIRVIDEHGNELPSGAVGEIVGKSAGMMSAYQNQPEKTAEAEWYSPQGERFIRTGDMGRFDEDGFLVLVDRKKDMIISGGFNIFPSDLEAELILHPAVADVAVVGVPSERWGETPVAFVVVRPGQAPTSEALLLWVNDRLGKMQRLAAVHLTAELPRSAIGKVLKRELLHGFRSGNGESRDTAG